MKQIFEPRSIAVVGASKTPRKPGYVTVENLLRLGFKGEIYPVNPNADDVLGLKAYPNIDEVPSNINLVVSVVPASENLDLVKESAEKGVKRIVIFSGGFSQSGEKGAALEKEVVEIAKANDVRIVGPMTIGPINPSKNLAVSPLPLKELRRGNVAFIAQTGQFCAITLEWLFSVMGVGVSKSLDLGNKSDVDDADILEYLEEDPDTKVIALHMEEAKNAKRFMDVARRVSGKKPIIVLKAGRTEMGARAAASHTASMAGSDRVYEAAFRQAGLIRAYSFDELVDFAKAFSYLPLPAEDNVAVATISGGSGVLVADAIQESNLKLASFSTEAENRLRSIIPPWAKVLNPFDFGTRLALDSLDETYRVTLEALLSDEKVGSVIMVTGAFYFTNQFETDFEIIVDVAKKHRDKPLVACVIAGENLTRISTRILENGGFPVYLSPERAVKALAALHRYSRFRKQVYPN